MVLYLHIIEEFIKNFFTKIGEAAAEFDFHAEMVSTPPYSKGKWDRNQAKSETRQNWDIVLETRSLIFYATLGNIRLDKDIQRECCIYVMGI